ncbi:MAG: homoserine kinase [Bryobacter sp.]
MTSSSPRRWRLRAPASSANLGPGFDTLGLALDRHLEVVFEPADSFRLELAGDTEGLPTNDSNFIWQTALDVAAQLGSTLPPAHLRVNNQIPLGKGMGSSAAALVCGIGVADALLGLNWSCEQIFTEAARREGHPDNVAAATFGGLAVAGNLANGQACHVRISPPEHLRVAVVVPHFPLPTRQARSVLPESYSKADLTFNLQRAALLVASLASGNLRQLRTALEDRVHQPYRSALVPGLDAILALDSPHLLGTCLSGAGPSVLVLARDNALPGAQLVKQTFAAHDVPAEVLPLAIDTLGFQREKLP